MYLCRFINAIINMQSNYYFYCVYALFVLGIYLFCVYYIMDNFYNKNASQRQRRRNYWKHRY